MTELSTGYVLNNRYRIVKRIGGGGFADIYRAWDLNLGRVCAIKQNQESTPAAQQQFEQEAMILAKLSHPHLAGVFDYFTIPGQGQYLVMDFIEGQDLQEMLEQSGPLPLGQALAWIAQVCNALEHLHTQTPPVIHRDIKPANIKITPQGKAVLVDFGIAKVYDPSRKTTRGARAVTPGFSPPEQYGQGRTDIRTDVYALGATLYALLTGQVPPESVLISAGQVSLLPVRSLNPGVTLAVETAIQGAMCSRPDDRYQDVAEFHAALHATRPTPPGSPARTSRTTTPMGTSVDRDRVLKIAGIVMLAVMAVTAAIYIFKRAQPEPSPQSTLIVQVSETSLSPQPSNIIPTQTRFPRTTEPPVLPTTTPPAPPNLAVRPLDGDGLVRMTNRPEKDYTPFLSPDQRTLLYTSMVGGSWHVMKGDPNRPGSDVQITSGNANYYFPCFSYDSNKALVVSDLGGDQDLYYLDLASGKVLEQLTDTPGDDYAPAWLPDYSGIVFTSNRGGNDEVYLLRLDGSPPQNLTNNPAFDGFPAVSRNGRQVAFYTNRDGNYEVYVMKLSELRPRRITNHSARDADPAFSPDGEWILFESERSGNYEIYAVRTDGSDLQNLTNHSADDYAPSFSPDGLWLLFMSDRDGNMELYRMPWRLEEQTNTASVEASIPEIRVNPKDAAEIMLIPAGDFLMGSDPENDPYFYGAEGPSHKVYLDEYWIYRVEVTNAMYQKCAEAKACPLPKGLNSDTRTEYYGNPAYANYPVVNVSHKNATAYCRWAEGRLPTEAEWEKAARGTDGRLFPWGNAPPRPNLANYGTADTEPVGSFPAGASPYGVLDMAGNVIEWVFDYFQITYYQVSPEENPLGPASGSSRVYRGGSYHNHDAAIRVVMRGSRSESHSNVDIGFRCVVDE